MYLIKCRYTFRWIVLVNYKTDCTRLIIEIKVEESEPPRRSGATEET